jgi:hypothetical protein
MSGLVCLSCGGTVKRRFNHARQWHEAQCQGCAAREESVHGRHWKAFTQENSRAARIARDGTGATAAGDSAAYTFNAPANTGAGQFTTFTSWFSSGLTAWPTLGHDYTQIERCAPEVGEIIAWRTWRFLGGYVQSMAADEVWEPQSPRVSDPSKIAVAGLFDTVDAGIHAWKSKQDALQYAGSYMDHYNTRTEGKREIVIGRVALWGVVFEHEKGYRAENAKIVAIEDILCWPDFPREYGIAWLRARYNVGGPS